jgi:hypothetical protein
VVYFSLGRSIVSYINYFAECISGRRPLSALGLVHVFRRRTLA